MSTSVTIDSYDRATTDETLEYRAIHTGAIVGLVLGLLSVFVLITAPTSLEYCLMTVPIPMVGIFISLRSWARIHREKDLLTGGKLAMAGLILSLFFLISGVSYSGYVYATEVPEGYSRISYRMMKPDSKELLNKVLVPPEIAALEGKPVFIKGYIRPDSIRGRTNIDQFLLVRDNNQCCFGDLSKVKFYDQIAVQFQDHLLVDYSSGIFRIGGILRIHPENFSAGSAAVVYSLEADYAK